MGRIIKFRGFSKKLNKWVCGELIKTNHSCYIVVGAIGFEFSEFNNELLCHQTYLVEKESIGQFTGLSDKNGKEIYEGDICNVTKENEESEIRTAVCKGDFFALDYSSQPISVIIKIGFKVEVIGNEYQSM